MTDLSNFVRDKNTSEIKIDSKSHKFNEINPFPHSQFKGKNYFLKEFHEYMLSENVVCAPQCEYFFLSLNLLIDLRPA